MPKGMSSRSAPKPASRPPVMHHPAPKPASRPPVMHTTPAPKPSVVVTHPPVVHTAPKLPVVTHPPVLHPTSLPNPHPEHPLPTPQAPSQPAPCQTEKPQGSVQVVSLPTHSEPPSHQDHCDQTTRSNSNLLMMHMMQHHARPVYYSVQNNIQNVEVDSSVQVPEISMETPLNNQIVSNQEEDKQFYIVQLKIDFRILTQQSDPNRYRAIQQVLTVMKQLDFEMTKQTYLIFKELDTYILKLREIAKTSSKNEKKLARSHALRTKADEAYQTCAETICEKNQAQPVVLKDLIAQLKGQVAIILDKATEEDQKGCYFWLFNKRSKFINKLKEATQEMEAKKIVGYF